MAAVLQVAMHSKETARQRRVQAAPSYAELPSQKSAKCLLVPLAAAPSRVGVLEQTSAGVVVGTLYLRALSGVGIGRLVESFWLEKDP